MPITPPIAGQEMSAANFGIPVAEAVNRAEWPFAFRLFLNASVTVPTGTGYVVGWTGEVFDASNMHVAGQSVVTIPTNGGGLWLFGATVTWAANATGVRTILYRKNGGTSNRLGAVDGPPTNAVSVTSQSTTLLLGMNVGDTLAVVVYHEAGTNLQVMGTATADDMAANFWGIRLGSV